MKKTFPPTVLSLLLASVLLSPAAAQQKSEQRIDLSGTWAFQTDSSDKGITDEWFNHGLKDHIRLPGSMTTNGKGDNITVNTPWTGNVVDKSWFTDAGYARYRQPGNIKVPFWLQPEKYYKGAAWYQKTITIPASWNRKNIQLFIERSHWETTVWIDDVKIGMDNSLGTPQLFDLGDKLLPGTHRLTIRVDNRVKDIKMGNDAHSVSDQTQGNWNGMVGELSLTARPQVFLADVQLYPDIKNKRVLAKIQVKNTSGTRKVVTLDLAATPGKPGAVKPKPLTQEITLPEKDSTIAITYPMGNNPLLWNEFHPDLYDMQVTLSEQKQNNTDRQKISFGMREFKASGTQFTINDTLTFLRGTLDCASFPKTGYPPTDVASWMKNFKTIKAYGMNHIRFHSWCPPEAAFTAADRLGIFLQVECSAWASEASGSTTVIGDGYPLDKYVYEEGDKMMKAYGNHPSFVMMTYGNEPSGKNQVKYLVDLVNYWKAKDARRMYTTAAGWPVEEASNYHNTPDPRVQGWGQGLSSIINKEAPRTDYDWTNIISKWNRPVVSHEVGQWCVYPNFKEIKKYDGVLKPKNFDIFRDKLQENGLLSLADSFFMASGKLQALCYKADVEAALRTPGFAGFQLLSLSDFPGQGTALIGVLDPFWEPKPYINATGFSQFCAPVVPLARLPKMVYTNNEELIVPLEVANFSNAPINNALITWNITSENGAQLFSGSFKKETVEIGNGIKLGTIRQTLATVKKAQRLVLKTKIGTRTNEWDIFVYPQALPQTPGEILLTQTLDANAIEKLNQGGKVLLTLKKGTVKPAMGGDISIGFSSIFWNTAWTNKQPPTTLGILCNPAHPALADFPTQYYSNWQWWDAMSHSSAIKLDALEKELPPIVRVIDDWVTARSLGLIFECSVGKGKLLVSGIDLLTDQDTRPEARQLRYSLEKYMIGTHFNPTHTMALDKIQQLYN
ncbi:sugar-binding domain-containing protein [Chitinophaga arvensicola]|uniref:beta-galactosidase n=1 Tax=Chitinophaga arvensicola TaxID=29529 RepID=A0A1I0S743_9BACT|nr:sugar-binding domain-containing protein [Chitinophaga arvensicola]SEW51549.1 Glycosyl hydrolases family 2, TIM barrel domain [Chitinophaga arvensicola]